MSELQRYKTKNNNIVLAVFPLSQRSPRAFSLCLWPKPFSSKRQRRPTPMTLGNMRANGVRTLAAWCLGKSILDRVNQRRIVVVSNRRYPAEKNTRKSPIMMTAATNRIRKGARNKNVPNRRTNNTAVRMAVIRVIRMAPSGLGLTT